MNLKILFPYLIVYLAFCDIIYLICQLPMQIANQAGVTYPEHPSYLIHTIMNFPGEIAFSGSILTTVLGAIDRYSVFYQDV